MNFEWKKELATGIESLDSHHQGIFSRANTFLQKCEDGAGMAEISELLDDLEKYTKMHFSYEERLQQINNFSGLKNQQASHALFLNDISELRTALEINGPTKELVLLTKGKLIRWLTQHIGTMDKEFSVFVKQRQS